MNNFVDELDDLREGQLVKLIGNRFGDKVWRVKEVKWDDTVNMYRYVFETLDGEWYKTYRLPSYEIIK